MPESRRRKPRMWPWLMLLLVLVAIISAFSTDLIPSESMQPTLNPGDQILTMRAWLAFPGGRMPARGDVVIFQTPDAEKEGNRAASGVAGTAEAAADPPRSSRLAALRNRGDLLIKRVVGLPGETVQIKSDGVYIDGKKLPMDYQTIGSADNVDSNTFATDRPLKLQPDELFVLGDNRDNSDDSRYWGPLQRKYIVGRYLRVMFHRSVPPTPKPTATP